MGVDVTLYGKVITPSSVSPMLDTDTSGNSNATTEAQANAVAPTNKEGVDLNIYKQAVPQEYPSGSNLNKQYDLNMKEYSPYMKDVYPDTPDINEERAQNQGSLDKAVNGIVKTAGLAATTFASSFTALPYGIVSAVVNQRAAEMVDNPFSRTYDDFNKSLETAFPNFYTKKEENAALYSPDYWFTTNFLFDKVIKNAGFTLGALAGGVGFAKIAGALGKLAMAGKYETEMAKVTLLINEGKTYREAIAEVGGGLRISNAFQKFGAAGFSAHSEAIFEGLDGKQSIKAELVKKYQDEHFGQDPGGDDLKRIEELSDAGANYRFAANLPLLMFDDLVEFGRVFTGSKVERKAFDNITRGVGEEYAIKEGSKLSRIGNNLTKILKVPLIEANEEGTQYAIQKATDDYYNRKYDKDSVSGFNEINDSIFKGLSDEFGTKEGLENIILGGVSGLGFGLATGQIRHDLKQDSQALTVADNLNKYSTTGLFAAKRDAVIRSMSIAKSMDKATADADTHAYKNAEWDYFKNLVDSRLKAGKFDDLIEDLHTTRGLGKDEIEKAFGQGFDGNDKTAGQYVDHLIQQAKELKSLRDDIDIRFGGYSEGIRDRMFDAASNGYNVDKREQQLASEIATESKGHVSPMTLKGLTGQELKDAIRVQEDAWKATNPNPLEVANVSEKFRDWSALQQRRVNFAQAYRQLLDPKFAAQVEAEDKVRRDEPKEKAFQQYKAETDNEVATSSDRNALLVKLKSEQAEIKDAVDEDYLEKYTDYLQGHISKLENEKTIRDKQTEVAATVATTPVVQPVVVETPQSTGKKIVTVDDFKAGRIYTRALEKVAKGTPEDIADGLDDLESAARSIKTPEIQAFIQSEIERLQVVEPVATESEVFSTAEINAEPLDILDLATGSVEVEKPKEEVVAAEAVAPDSANGYIFTIDGVGNIIRNGHPIIKRNAKTGDYTIVSAKDEAGIIELLSGKIKEGDQIRLVVNENNKHGIDSATSQHTLNSLPIELHSQQGNFLGFLNNLDTLIPIIDRANEILASDKIHKLAGDLATATGWEAKFLKTRLNDLGHSVETDKVYKPLSEVVQMLKDNFDNTKTIREAVWEAHQKDKAVKLNTTVTRLTSGDIVNAEFRNPIDIFGANPKLYTLVVGSTTELITTGKQKSKHILTTEPRGYTNPDGKYLAASVYTVVKGANGQEIASPLRTEQVNREAATEVFGHIVKLLDYLKEGKPLDSQEVANEREAIKEFIYVPMLNSLNTSFKIYPDSIKIDDVNQSVVIYTKVPDKTGAFVPINEGVNLRITDKTNPEATVTINSVKDTVVFKEEVMALIESKTRQIDFAKLQDETTEYRGEKNYKTWLFNSGAITTDVGQVHDSKGNVVSNVNFSGKYKGANLVLSIDSKVSTGVVETKGTTEAIPEVIPTLPATSNSAEDLGGFDILNAAYNPNASIVQTSQLQPYSLNDYGFVNDVSDSEDALKGVLKTSTDPFTKSIAEFLLPLIETNVVSITFKRGMINPTTGKAAGTHYRPSENKIYIATEQSRSISQFNRMLVHEVIHSMTAYPFVLTTSNNHTYRSEATESEKTYVNEINRLYNYTVKTITEREGKTIAELKKDNLDLYYGLTHVHEFIAELQSREEFAEMVDKIKDETTSVSVKKGFWTAVWDWFKTLFNTTKATDTTSVYQSANKAIKNFIENDFVIRDLMKTLQRSRNEYLNDTSFSPEVDTHYVNIMSALVAGDILKNTELAKLDKEDLGDFINDPFKVKVRNALLKTIEVKLLKDEHQEHFVKQIADSIEGDKDDLGFWAKTKRAVDRALQVDIDDDIDINEDQSSLRNWDETAQARISQKVGLSRRIRLLFMTSPILSTTNFTVQTIGNKQITRYDANKNTISGIAEFLSWDIVHPRVLREMIGSSSPTEMLTRLSTMATQFDPSFIKIVHNLDGDPVLLSDWFSHFNLKNPRKEYQKIETVRSEVKTSIEQSNRDTDATYLISNKWITKIKAQLEAKVYDVKFFVKFNEDEKSLAASRRKLDTEASVKTTSDLLNDLGVTISPDIITKEIHSTANLEEYRINDAKGVLDMSRTLDSILGFKFVDKLRLIADSLRKEKYDNDGDINALASIAAFYTYDRVEGTSVSVNGRMIYGSTQPNGLSKFFDMLHVKDEGGKQVRSRVIGNFAKDNALRKYSNWQNLLDSNEVFLANFQYIDLDGSKNVNTKEGADYTEYTDEDWKLLKLTNYLKGVEKSLPKTVQKGWTKIVLLTPSDKGHTYFLQVPKIQLVSGQLTGSSLNRNSSLYKAVANTVAQELERMKSARSLLFNVAPDGTLTARDINGTALIKDYHFKDYDENDRPILLKNGKPTGRVFEFLNIPSLNRIDGLRTNGVIVENTLTEAVQNQIKASIDAFITRQISSTITEYSKHQTVVEGQHNHIGDGSYHNLIAEYALNTFIANVEQGNYIQGTLSEFKDIKTPVKRYGGIISPGATLSQIHTGETYTGAIIRDAKIASSMYEAYIKKLDNKELKSYSNTNVADSQGYITLSRARNVLKDIGKWNSDYDKLYSAFTKGEDVNKEVLNSFLQVFKPFYDGMDYDARLNRTIHTQIKTSLFPLIPGLSDDLDALKKAMDKQGIDELYFESSAKVGGRGLATLSDDTGKLIKDNLSKLVPITYYNRNYQVQQNVQQHMIDEQNKLGTQPSKLIVSNIDLTGDYKVGNTTIKGKELIGLYHENLVSNIKESSDKLVERLTTNGKADLNKMQAVMEGEISRLNKSNNLLSSIEVVKEINGDEHFKLPLFTKTIDGDHERILTSLFTNNVSNQKHPGFHAALVSSVFFNGSTDKGVEYTQELHQAVAMGKRDYRLQTKISPDGGVVHEILVPAWSSKFFSNGQRISIDDIPQEIREMIIYRIPYDAKHSGGLAEVVGFLPQGSGSVLVVPDDMVTRVGLDYDLDTMYAMTYNFTGALPVGIKMYQGAKGEFDDREFNYFTRGKGEAANYGSNVREVRLNPTKILYKYEKDGTPSKDFEDVEKSLGLDDKGFRKSFDILDNSVEGLAHQNKFFAEAKKKGFDAYSEIHNGTEVRPFADENEYMVSLDNSIINNDKGFTKVPYLTGTTEADVTARYNLKYGKKDELLVYLDNIIAKEYDEVVKTPDKAVEDLLDVIFKNTPLMFNDGEIDEILRERGFSLALYEAIAAKVRKNPTRGEFAKLSVSDQNSKQARQNNITDMFKGVYDSSTHLLEQILPSEFSDLVEIAENIDKAYGESAESIHPFTDRGQNLLRRKVVDGRALKGMSSLVNAATGIFQKIGVRTSAELSPTGKFRYSDFGTDIDIIAKHRELKARYGSDFTDLGDDNFTIKFKNLGTAPDGSYLNVEGEQITMVISRIIANTLDLVKEGWIANINTYTFDGWVAMQVQGMTAESASWFYNQPIIRTLTKNYFNSKGLLEVKTSNEIEDTKRDAQTVLYGLLTQSKDYKADKTVDNKTVRDANKVLDKNKTLSKQAKQKIYLKRDETVGLLKYNPDEELAIDAHELKEQVDLFRKYDSLSSEDKIKHITYQLRVLENFIRRKEAGEAIKDGINALNVDGIGASPTMNTTRGLEAIIRKGKSTPRLHIGDKTMVEAVYPTLFDSKEESVYPPAESFYKYANQRSLKVLSPLFIQQTVPFRDLVDQAISLLGGGVRGSIAQAVADFGNVALHNELPYFDEANRARILGISTILNYDTSIAIEDFKNLSTANKVLLVQAQEPMQDEMKENPNHILNYLEALIDAASIERNNFQMLKWTNVGKDSLIDDYITESLLSMYNSEDPYQNDLAEDLIKYSHITTGMGFSQQSFGKNIPTSILADDAPHGIGLASFLRAKKEDFDNEGTFRVGVPAILDQYIRNHWYDKSIVPIVRTEYVWENKHRKAIYEEGSDEPIAFYTKNNTPIWVANADGIIRVAKTGKTNRYNNLKRSSAEIRKSNYLRVDDKLYQKFLGETGNFEYYYPIHKLGTPNLYEFSETSVIPNNNAPQTSQHYTSIIEGYIGGIKAKLPEVVTGQDDIKLPNSFTESRYAGDHFDEYKYFIKDNKYYKIIPASQFEDSFKRVGGVTREITREEYIKEYFNEYPIKTKDHKMSYAMPAAENIWGVDTTTLAESESGRRTATTRSFALGKVGDIVTFEGRPQRYRITGIEQLTSENTKDSSWIKKWSDKEGWTVEHFTKVLGGSTVHVGSFQTSFEKIEDAQTSIQLPIIVTSNVSQKDIDDNYNHCI